MNFVQFVFNNIIKCKDDIAEVISQSVKRKTDLQALLTEKNPINNNDCLPLIILFCG